MPRDPAGAFPVIQIHQAGGRCFDPWLRSRFLTAAKVPIGAQKFQGEAEPGQRRKSSCDDFLAETIGEVPLDPLLDESDVLGKAPLFLRPRFPLMGKLSPQGLYLQDQRIVISHWLSVIRRLARRGNGFSSGG